MIDKIGIICGFCLYILADSVLLNRFSAVRQHRAEPNHTLGVSKHMTDNYLSISRFIINPKAINDLTPICAVLMPINPHERKR